MNCLRIIPRVWSQSSNGMAYNEEISEHEENCCLLLFIPTHLSTKNDTSALVGIHQQRYRIEKEMHFWGVLSTLMRRGRAPVNLN
ncbi:hypothetical protein TNCV_1962451 [Trichonephila clavipes]|nr:hypothetical protein TNCV_1962451 [Trichonephila clavipes]